MNELSKSDLEFVLNYIDENLCKEETYYYDFLAIVEELIRCYKYHN